MQHFREVLESLEADFKNYITDKKIIYTINFKTVYIQSNSKSVIIQGRHYRSELYRQSSHRVAVFKIKYFL